MTITTPTDDKKIPVVLDLDGLENHACSSGTTTPQMVREQILAACVELRERRAPVAMRIMCPQCGFLHIDVGEFATKPHHTHACQMCGNVWRPAIVATVGVRFLPGFKND